MIVSTLVSEYQVQEVLEIMHKSVAKTTRRDPILEIMHESVARTTRRDRRRECLLSAVVQVRPVLKFFMWTTDV